MSTKCQTLCEHGVIQKLKMITRTDPMILNPFNTVKVAQLVKLNRTIVLYNVFFYRVINHNLYR